MTKLLITFSSLLMLSACSSASSPETSGAPQTDVSQATPHSGATDTAILAGGCFWCVESDFEKLDGVIDAVSGYTGGTTTNPDYKQVSHSDTGHFEAVKVTYDPAVLSYDDILDYFWRHIDPTDPRGQFCDKGESYKSAIFARPEQIETAENSKAALEANKPFDGAVVTEVLTAKTFYLAEDYHQDYYKKNPLKYKYYRTGCRRDARIKDLWGHK